MKMTLLAALLLTLAGVNAPAGVIALVPSNATPFVGDPLTINLIVTGNTDELLGFGLDHSVSTAAIAFQSFAIDPFFGADLGLQPDTLVSAFAFPGNTNSSVTLVSFTFLASSVGTSVFSVTSDLLDPNEGLFALDLAVIDLDTQVTIDVLAAPGVPEPGTFGLGAGAAVGLFFAGRRFRRRGLVGK